MAHSKLFAHALVLLSVTACPPVADAPVDSQHTTTATSTSSTSTTSSSPTTGAPDGVTGPAGTTTGEQETTGESSATTSEPAETYECDQCPAGEVCVQRFQVHQFCNSSISCAPNPYGCVPSDPCSAACQDLCGTNFCTIQEIEGCGILGPLNCAYDPNEAYHCDPWEQDCVEGKKCGPYEAPGCIPVDPMPAAVGEPCTFPLADNCELGAVCLGGRCEAQCIGSLAEPSCAAPDKSCVIAGGWTLCVEACDPLAASCAVDEVCIPLGSQKFICAFEGSPDAGAASTPCMWFNDCDKGMVCAESWKVSSACEQGYCCTPWCDLTDPIVCPEPDQECSPWYVQGDFIPDGQEDLGACMVP